MATIAIWPVSGYPVSQAFGPNPNAYAKFGLLGHNGIDFAVPAGKPVVAVNHGRVVEATEDPGGYGLYVKLTHGWGETLYAHLSKILVKAGEAVRAGNAIGLSGNTGNSTGPHLHFGMRITPYFRDDGWGGYSDPWPHLKERPQTVDRLGPHLAGSRVGEMIETIGKWRPAYAVYLDPSPDMVRAIKAASPATRVVGRVYRPDSEVADRIKADPAEAARWFDGLVRSHPAFNVCDYWQIANEVCQVDRGEFRKLCSTMFQWMGLARNDYKCAIFGFSVGQPDLPEGDRMAYWRETIPALERAIAGGHVLLIHQYGAPDLWGPNADYAEWHINRFEHQVWSRLGYLDKVRKDRGSIWTLKAIRVVVGEYGIDGLLRGEKKGWRGYTDTEGYLGQLRTMADYLEKWPTIGGYCLYTCGHASDEWASYDIWPEVAQGLAGGKPFAGSLEQVLLTEAEAAQVMQFNPGAALQKQIFVDGFVPNSQEFRFTHDGLRFVAQRAEHIETGEVRVYYCQVDDWQNVNFVVRS